jgi:hypothetical protein
VEFEFYIEDFEWKPSYLYAEYETKDMAKYYGHKWFFEASFLWFGITIIGKL